MVIPRSRSSGALSIDANFSLHRRTLLQESTVMAAVRVVLPWSTWPIVPTFTCGFVRSNFSLDMSCPSCTDLEALMTTQPKSIGDKVYIKRKCLLFRAGAYRQILTADLILTKDALYHLSYISTQKEWSGQSGIEPASSAWKAEVIAIT